MTTLRAVRVRLVAVAVAQAIVVAVPARTIRLALAGPGPSAPSVIVIAQMAIAPVTVAATVRTSLLHAGPTRLLAQAMRTLVKALPYSAFLTARTSRVRRTVPIRTAPIAVRAAITAEIARPSTARARIAPATSAQASIVSVNAAASTVRIRAPHATPTEQDAPIAAMHRADVIVMTPVTQSARADMDRESHIMAAAKAARRGRAAAVRTRLSS